MLRLGWMYEDGTGVAQNYATAKYWYEKSIEKGSSRAMNTLGWMYLQGTGVSKDYRLAKTWFEKAIQNGNLGNE